MNNKEGKGEPWKRGKTGMNKKEGKEEPWKRGKKGMNNKKGKEEPWKRGKVKPEQRKIEMANEVEKGNPRKKIQKLAFEIFPRGFPSPLCWPPLRPFFRFGLPSLPRFFLSLFSFHPFHPSLP